MSEERDRKLAALFERQAVDLSSDEFVANIRRRIGRDIIVMRLLKAMMFSALIGVGVFYADQMNHTVATVQGNIEHALNRLVSGAPLATIGKMTIASLAIGLFVWRRFRRWGL